jgi:hypothetical protein
LAGGGGLSTIVRHWGTCTHIFLPFLDQSTTSVLLLHASPTDAIDKANVSAVASFSSCRFLVRFSLNAFVSLPAFFFFLSHFLVFFLLPFSFI